MEARHAPPPAPRGDDTRRTRDALPAHGTVSGWVPASTYEDVPARDNPDEFERIWMRTKFPLQYCSHCWQTVKIHRRKWRGRWQAGRCPDCHAPMPDAGEPPEDAPVQARERTSTQTWKGKPIP